MLGLKKSNTYSCYMFFKAGGIFLIWKNNFTLLRRLILWHLKLW